MSEKKYNLTKALSWYTVGNILVKSINFITLRLFTSLMSTADYGVFGLYQSYLAIFEIAILLGASHTIKMVKYDSEVDYDRYVSSIIAIPIIGTIIGIITILIYSEFSNVLLDLSVNIWFALIITSGLIAVVNIITAKLILDGRYKPFITYSFINTVVNITVSLLLCYTIFKSHDTYWARIYGGIASNAVSIFFLCFYMNYKRISLSYIKKGVLLGLPLLVHAIATQVLVQSDKIIINELASLSEVGIYSVAATIVIIPTTIMASIESSWSPWYFKELSERNYGEIRKRNNLIVVAYAVLIILFIFATPEIVRIIADKKYWDAIYILMPLSIATFAELVYLIPLNLELYYKKNKVIWIYTTSVVVFNIIVDVAGIKLFGYLAAAYVTCLSRFLLFALHYIRSKKIDSNLVFDLKIIIICIITMFGSSFACIFMSEMLIARWVIIAILLVILGIYVFFYYKKSKDNEER